MLLTKSQLPWTPHEAYFRDLGFLY